MQKECKNCLNGLKRSDFSFSKYGAYYCDIECCLIENEDSPYVTFLGFVDVSFACNLPRSMHVVKRDTAVDDFHSVLSHDVGDRSAAAEVDLTKLSHLVRNLVLVECRA